MYIWQLFDLFSSFFFCFCSDRQTRWINRALRYLAAAKSTAEEPVYVHVNDDDRLGWALFSSAVFVLPSPSPTFVWARDGNSKRSDFRHATHFVSPVLVLRSLFFVAIPKTRSRLEFARLKYLMGGFSVIRTNSKLLLWRSSRYLDIWIRNRLSTEQTLQEMRW